MSGFTGDKLKEFRNRKKLTQADLAAELQVNRITIAKWEALGPAELPHGAQGRLLAWAHARAKGETFDAHKWAREFKFTRPRKRVQPIVQLGTMKGSDLEWRRKAYQLQVNAIVEPQAWCAQIGLTMRQYRKLCRNNALLPLGVQNRIETLT
jgi:transcriptional regulator with XRE-family HTH domain